MGAQSGLPSVVRTSQCVWGATFYPYTQAVVKMVEQKNVQSPSPATLCCTTIDRRMLDPTKKRYPTSKGKGDALAR